MFAFLRPPMIFEDQIESSINDAAGNKIQRLELEIRDRYDKANNFNPDDCFETTRSNISVKSQLSDDSNDINYTPPKGNAPSQNIGLVKAWSTVAEVSSTIIIVIATILCLVENEEFYESNKSSRVLLSLLTNSLATEFYNTTTDLYPNNYTAYGRLMRMNLNDILEQKNFTLIQEKISKFLDNLNYTNLTLLEDYDKIDNPLEINEYCASLRWAILISTLISGNHLS